MIEKESINCNISIYKPQCSGHVNLKEYIRDISFDITIVNNLKDWAKIAYELNNEDFPITEEYLNRNIYDLGTFDSRDEMQGSFEKGNGKDFLGTILLIKGYTRRTILHECMHAGEELIRILRKQKELIIKDSYDEEVINWYITDLQEIVLNKLGY